MKKSALRIIILFSVLCASTAAAHSSNTPISGEIAFVSERDGFPAVYGMNSDGSNQQRLSSDNETNQPDWSPDGTTLAFTSIRRAEDGSPTAIEIHTLDASSSRPTNLTAALSENGLTAHAPVWSPDGTMIAFGSHPIDIHGPHSGANVYVMQADGSDHRQLTQVTSGSVGCGAERWLPDSVHLIAACTGLMQDWLITIDTTDGTQETLDDDAADPFMISPSPNGEQVAYLSAFGLTLLTLDRPQSKRILYLHDLVQEPDPFPIAFVWSPVEQNVMLVQTCRGLYRLNINRAAVELLATITDHCVLGPRYDSPLAWSPDGSAVIFLSDHEGNAELYRLNISSGEILRLTDNSAVDMLPVWRPLPPETQGD